MNKALVLFAASCGLVACSESPETAAESSPASSETAFVGSASCASCHSRQAADWQGSHHEEAMQPANDETVLGDFGDASVKYFGATSRMYRDGDAFYMRTSNARGENEDFRVSHTFGVYPLQQYLTDFPDGRKQVLPFAWDARPADEGGQRWYHLYPDEEVGPKHVFFWTKRFANWNIMCAECHSTDLQVNYDLPSDRFDTTWSEVSVGCEACHGPGSEHVWQAASGFDDEFGLQIDLGHSDGVTWQMNDSTGIAYRSEPLLSGQQVESCGRCHSRRSVIAETYEYGKPLLDTHRVALLEENLYHADGRILDEVYVYGSFVQSKMYRAGVTCSDCHNPHSGELKTGPEPNDVCGQCHAPAVFASTDHAPNDNCVSCHMQAETYMGVDVRRDHSFRLPDTGTDPEHYGAAITAARLGNADPQAAHNPTYPMIARATVLSLLRAPFNVQDVDALQRAIDDPDPLMRTAALSAIHAAPPEMRPLAGTSLLRDPVRAVRTQAALTYAQSRDLLPIEDARVYADAADEFRASLLVAASTPESLSMLADFEYRLGDNGKAMNYLEYAKNLDPDHALTRHSLGLALVRERRYDEALTELEQAYRLEPESPRFAYVYAVALNQLGQVEQAIAVMDKAREDFPNDTDIQSFWQILNR